MERPNSEIRPDLSGEDVIESLDPLYPDVRTPLFHKSPFQLLIATILSAQTTDAQVNRVTPKLFKNFPNALSLAKASIRQLETIIRSTGYYHVKSRRIREVSRQVLRDFHGVVPQTMDALLTLTGVGRKTANIVLSAGFEKIEGIAVDTHVFRVSRRLGLTKAKTPEKVEQDLMKVTPQEQWPRLTMLLILHGRAICHARNPLCGECVLAIRCVYFKKLKAKA